LGNIAEINLSRALTITDTWETAVTAFLTRPWSLFFLILAIFSAVFPWYQAARADKRWTRAFVPLLVLAVSVPLFMMGGVARPIIAAIVVAFGAYTLWRRARDGWQISGQN
jgi:putative tricarboxylic transport membrane protein